MIVTRKQIISSIIFIIILCLLLLGLSRLLEPKNNRKEDGILDYRANGIFAEPKNSIDIVYLGDSETYSSIIPLNIWEEYGITSYVCGTSAQKLYYSKELLEKVFQNQSPKIIVLETDTIFKNFSYSKEFIHKAEQYFSIFRYHDRWKSLQKVDWSFHVDYQFINDDKGYRYHIDCAPANTSDYMKRTNKKEPISSSNKRYLKDINSLCKEHNCELLLLSTPSVENWNYKRHNAISKLAKDMELTFIDMNLMSEEIPIDWSTDTRDQGDHLNYYGALKVTKYLGNYFDQLNIFEDKRLLLEYESWNDSLKKFHAITKEN